MDDTRGATRLPHKASGPPRKAWHGRQLQRQLCTSCPLVLPPFPTPSPTPLRIFKGHGSSQAAKSTGLFSNPRSSALTHPNQQAAAPCPLFNVTVRGRLYTRPVWPTNCPPGAPFPSPPLRSQNRQRISRTDPGNEYSSVGNSNPVDGLPEQHTTLQKGIGACSQPASHRPVGAVSITPAPMLPTILTTCGGGSEIAASIMVKGRERHRKHRWFAFRHIALASREYMFSPSV